jgi:FKBP-type peptidyl-prolyl cis-trans isomerase (trigger factor)
VFLFIPCEKQEKTVISISMSTTQNGRELRLYQNITLEKTPEGDAVLTGEIAEETLAFFKVDALKHFQAELELPGFRKGHVPEKIVLERVGEIALLEEAAEMILQKSMPEIIKEQKLDIIDRPEVVITKLAVGSPVTFKITAPVFPQFQLPDYKKIATKEGSAKEKIEVTEQEVDEAIKQIKRMKMDHDIHGDHDHSDPNHVHKEIKDEDLPELTDDLVKEYGKFENVLDFKNKVKESIVKEKEMRAKEKKRLTIIKAIIKEISIPLPKVLIESELDRMLGRMQDDIERMGLKVNDYLKRIGKTENDLRKEWEEDAKERVKMDLTIDAIAREEKIVAPDEEVEAEVKHLMEHYQDADPMRATSYFRHIIRNEKVFQFLETQ